MMWVPPVLSGTVDIYVLDARVYVLWLTPETTTNGPDLHPKLGRDEKQ